MNTIYIIDLEAVASRYTIEWKWHLPQLLKLHSQQYNVEVIEGTDASQNVRLDFSNTAITIIQGVDVGQNSRMTIIENTDLSQNVRLAFSNTRMDIIKILG